MANNISYYVKIVDSLSGFEKTFNLDTTKTDQQSAVVSLVISDDILSLYPYGVFILKDSSGIFFSDFPFAEGHKFKITLGLIEDTLKNKKTRFISGEYYWTKTELSTSEKGGSISGNTLHHFIHVAHLKDGIFIDNLFSKSKRYYSNKKISDVVKSLITPDFVKETKSVLVTETKGARDWYLLEYSVLDYISSILVKYAIPVKNESPFFCFFNLKNEFHFRSGYDLCDNRPLPPLDPNTKQSFVINTYVLNFNNPIFSSDPFTIIDYTFIYLGSDEYQRLINMNNYTINVKNGKSNKLSTNLADNIYNPLGKIPIKSPKFVLDKRENNIKDIRYHGLFENNNFFKAKVYYQYSNVVFIVRMKITIYFNPDAVSGKVINLKCFDSKGRLNTVFSGRWVILKSEHSYELQAKLGNRMIVTNLEIGKNSFSYSEDNGYYYDKSMKSNSNILT